MNSVKRPIKVTLYLTPRLLLVAVSLSCTVLVLAGSFQVFEPILAPFVNVARGGTQQLSATLTIGPYPREAEVLQLKRQGYDAVLSLLNTRLPQERALNYHEARVVRQQGMLFYQVPFSYLGVDGSQNRYGVQQVASILRATPGKRFYIHCYLGRHRVGYLREQLSHGGGL